MAQARGLVRVHVSERAVWVRVEGRGTMFHVPPVRRLVEQRLSRGLEKLLIDLRDCVSMDSTFLGTLLALQRQLRGHGELLLVSPSPACSQLLKQMRLERLFRVGIGEGVPQQWQEIAAEPDCSDELKQDLVRAHQELAAVPGPAGEPFRKLAEELDRDTGRS